MKLGKYIATCGMASRRQAIKLIADNRVTVNGEVVQMTAFEVTDADIVKVDNQRCRLPEKFLYVLLNKPRGYVCSNADVHAKKLAIDLIDIPEVRLYSAGRLDQDSEGAIIFSNDGDFVAHLTHPRYEVLKVYDVITDSDLAYGSEKRILNGIMDDGDMLKAQQFKRLGLCHYRFTLNEGRKREIRRLTAACGAKTLRLKRLSIGNVDLLNLPVGKWRYLTPDEIAEMKKIFKNMKKDA